MIDLTGIIAISGQPGLYKVIAQSKNGIIIEALADKKRTTISSTSKVSSLEDISMFTNGDDKPVSEIMKSIFDREKGGVAVDAKSDDKTIVDYFASILPEYDKDRVYVSNMRKLFSWYNILQTTGNLKERSEEKAEDSTEKKITAPAIQKATAKKTSMNEPKAKTSAGVKKTAGVRKTGSA